MKTKHAGRLPAVAVLAGLLTASSATAQKDHQAELLMQAAHQKQLVEGQLPSGTANAGSVPVNVDVSQRHLNEAEEAIAVNPTNPNNSVIFTNVAHKEAGLSAGMFLAVSFDGGATWTSRLVGNNDNLGDSCCDPSLSFDEFGNLFMTYLYEVENVVPIALSTDGGLTFNVIANIAAPPKTTGQKAPGDNRGLFRYVDQPTVTAAKGEVWVVFNAGGPIFATGAPVSGLGQVGAFLPGQVVPGTNNCDYADVAIGPAGQVIKRAPSPACRRGKAAARYSSTSTRMVSARRGSATACLSSRHTSAVSTRSRRSPTAPSTTSRVWHGIEMAAPTTAGSILCTTPYRRMGATTSTFLSASPTTTVPPGAPACE